MSSLNKVAIIAFFHPEASISLSKYLSKKGIEVDFYYVTDILRDTGSVPGFEYKGAKRNIGIVKLESNIIKEIDQYSAGLPLNFFLLRIISFSKYIKPINNLVLWISLSIIKRKKYSAINIIGQHPWVEFIHKKLKNENITHTLHEVNGHNNCSQSSLIKRIISDETKTILCSNITYKRFVAFKGVNTEKVFNIPFGALETLNLYNDENSFLNLKQDNDFIFLFYGFILPYKGLDILLKAFMLLNKKYKGKKYKLIVAGAGNDENLIALSNLNHVTVINRYLKNSELKNLNEIADCILCPYLSASQSGIINSSLMFNVPVIATRVGAFPEIIKNRINGLLIEPNSPVALYNSMVSVLSEKELIIKLRNGTFLFGVNDEYNWDKISLKTLKVLDKLT